MNPAHWSLNDAVTDSFAIIDEPELRALKEAAPRRDGEVRGWAIAEWPVLVESCLSAY